MQIVNCRSYHARTVKQTLLRMPDEKSIFKIYYISVIGRDTPEKYEWEHCPHTQDGFEKFFLLGKHEGIGFVLAFPHVTNSFLLQQLQETGTLFDRPYPSWRLPYTCREP